MTNGAYTGQTDFRVGDGRLLAGSTHTQRVCLEYGFKQPKSWLERLYLTSSPDVLCMECCSSSDYQQLAHTLSAIPEDKTASIEEKQRLVKYRRIDRSIILTLKRFYDYRDEISGEKIGDEYGDSVVEAHHIDYFTRSQNNDSTNIIIISPNCHRIIHKNNPSFNRRKFQFEFENGEVLRLKLYEHLENRYYE